MVPKKIFVFLLTIFCIKTSFSIIPLEEAQREISEAEEEFQRAKKMFNPWYGGPLLTGSPSIITPGYVNLQPYLFILDNYAAFDSSRKSRSIPDLLVIRPLTDIHIGIINWMDIIIEFQGYYKKQNNQSSFNFGDCSATLNFGIYKETAYIPNIKFYIKESFPTGKYQKLKSYKANVDSSGSGSYTTSFGIVFGKIIWWWLTHPISLRLAFNYSVPAKVSVKNFNTYGGGFGTKGKVNPGNVLAASFGYEQSITQKLVLAFDLAYEADDRSTFKGIKGVTSGGDEATVGNPSSDVFSLAPALEYNFNPNVALIAGAWFSVYGRNTNNFAGGVITVTATF